MGIRYSYYTIGLMLLAAIPAAGQYTPTAWPPWEYPREGKVHAEDSYQAVGERMMFCSGEMKAWSNAAPTWYRSQYANLRNLKTVLGAFMTNYHGNVNLTNSMRHGSLTYYIDYGRILNEAPSMLDWINAQDFHRENILNPDIYIPPINWFTIASNACLPTNYFTYTPDRCLNGLGPLTNDKPVIGHPHGWTNAVTAVGGPFLPAGRTMWYTTDYGWAGITSIVAALDVLVLKNEDGYYTSLYAYSALQDDVPYPDWADVMADIHAMFAITNSVPSWWVGIPNHPSARQIAGGFHQYDWKIEFGWDLCEISSMIMGPTNEVNWFNTYCFVTNAANYTATGNHPADYTFDANGTGFIFGEYNQISGSSSNSLTNISFYTKIGRTNQPNDCVDPIDMGNLVDHVTGWGIEEYNWRRQVLNPVWKFK